MPKVVTVALIDTGKSFGLLNTDHLMPGINGTNLAKRMLRARPGTAILLASGYAEREGLDPVVPRLSKPFRKNELATSLAHLGRGA